MPAVGVEHGVELLPELLGRLLRALAELGLHALGDLLELGLHELRVGAGLLAVEHARADLERVDGDRVGIQRLSDQAGKRLVGDDEPVDADAVVLRGDVGMAKWGCGFHGLAVARYA